MVFERMFFLVYYKRFSFKFNKKKKFLLNSAPPSQCSKLTREIRSTRKTKEESLEERDIDLRELRDFNRAVNKMLLEVMQEHADLRDAIEMYFQQVWGPLNHKILCTINVRE